jgi:hypothetical protein
MYIACKVFYLVRLVIYWLLGILRFFSKPGSRIIVPVLLIGLAYEWRPELHKLLARIAWELDRSFRPDAVDLDVTLAALLLPATCSYVIVSKVLAVLLGAFPVATRPLPPLRRMKAPKQDTRPVVVRVVVPPLRRGEHGARHQKPASDTAVVGRA